MTHCSLGLCNSHPPSLYLEPSPPAATAGHLGLQDSDSRANVQCLLVLLPGMVALTQQVLRTSTGR